MIILKILAAIILGAMIMILIAFFDHFIDLILTFAGLAFVFFVVGFIIMTLFGWW